MAPGLPDTSTRLIRALGPFMAGAVVVGTVVGSGIFKKPQSVAENVPNFGMAALVWVLGGLLAILGALALAEVAVLFPKAGGNYLYLREGYGPLWGFLYGWVEFWIIRGAALAALASVFTESLHNVLNNRAFREALGFSVDDDLLGFWGQRWLTVSVIAVVALVNIRGVKWGGVLQVVITTVKIGALLGILVLPFAVAAFAGPDSTAPPPDAELLRPTWPDSWSAIRWSGVGTAMVGVMFAYNGWMAIGPMAEEVRRPQLNLPLALLGGTGVVLFLYLGANLAYYLIIPRPEMAALKTTSVAAVFSERLLGPLGAAAAAAAVMFSTFGAVNGNLLAGPRLLYAMGEDGLALCALGTVHPRFHTPALAIVVLAAWAALLVMAVALGTETKVLSPDKDHFNYLTDFAMFGALTFETLAVASIFVIRARFPDVARPYRCPLYPMVPALYCAVMVLVVVNMFWEQRLESLTGVAFIGVGTLVFWWTSGRRKSPVQP